MLAKQKYHKLHVDIVTSNWIIRKIITSRNIDKCWGHINMEVSTTTNMVSTTTNMVSTELEEGDEWKGKVIVFVARFCSCITMEILAFT